VRRADDDEKRVELIGQPRQASSRIAALLVIGPGDVVSAEQPLDGLPLLRNVALVLVLELLGVRVDAVVLDRHAVHDVQLGAESCCKVDGDRKSRVGRGMPVVSCDEVHERDLSLGRVLRRLALVFSGGCVGGLLRYAVTRAWSTPGNGFPWSTFVVNVAGAFVLGVVVVVATQRRARSMRLLIGTGFCGALTTFSSVVVAAAHLFAHGHSGTATAYLVLTSVAGIFAAVLGLGAARATVARW